jgi:hypothetical protein
LFVRPPETSLKLYSHRPSNNSRGEISGKSAKRVPNPAYTPLGFIADSLPYARVEVLLLLGQERGTAGLDKRITDLSPRLIQGYGRNEN